MKRRLFIKQTGILAGAAMVAPSLMSAKKKETKLVILHTNDTHSNIDPFPKNHAKFPDMGGVSRRAALIKSIREQEDNVLLLDAGDIFQGTPYFNKFKGVLEMKTMSEMQYDVVTLGNHDFDIGIDGYVKAKEHGTFKVVNANYDLSKTAMHSHVEPHVVIKKGGLKIGIFGVGIDLDGLVAKENTSGLIYNDPVASANQQVALLKQKGCDYIICLSHLGFEYPTDKMSDKILAQKTEGIDLIIGGHTHTFLDAPVVLKNTKGEDVLINQVGYGGLHLGRIDIQFSTDLNKTTIGECVPLTSKWDLA
ncbi:MAG: metallophosphoesterase [Fluviicola sp.]|nr:metallophosphoesterase [Fluviicola sp.]